MNHERRRIRPYQEEDESAVVVVWHRAGLAEYTYLPTWQAFTLEHAREVFRDFIRANCDIWVGTLDGQVVAYLAMDGSSIDRLYVDPAEWRRGWGTRFVQFAKNLCPDGLALFTHQENGAARALYEKHGFKPVKFGLSPRPSPRPTSNTTGARAASPSPSKRINKRRTDETPRWSGWLPDIPRWSGWLPDSPRWSGWLPDFPVGRVGYPTFPVGRVGYPTFPVGRVGYPTFPLVGPCTWPYRVLAGHD